MSTLVAVFAHPDDETFICGGALARAAAEGHRVVLVCATRGEMGRRMGVPPTATRESIGAVRETELKEACAALGIARLQLLGLRDKSLEIQPRRNLVEPILAALMDEQPRVVLTFHPQHGGHPDHCAIGFATVEAFAAYQREFAAAKLRFVAWQHMVHEAHSLQLTRDQFIRLDVTDYALPKLLAFRAHRTQSAMNDAIWQDDKRSAARLEGYEYFLQAHAPYQRDATTLIDQ